MESNSDMRDESGKAGSAILRVLIKLLLGAAAAVSLRGQPVASLKEPHGKAATIRPLCCS